MKNSTSMTICLASFFWVAVIILILKILLGIRGVGVDAAFVFISLAVLLLAFSNIMATRCGTAPFGEVMKAVLPPWLLMMGGVVVLIRIFPGWIQPFSNTFGYLVCLMPNMNSREKLKKILNKDNTTMYNLVVEEPTLMLNQFSSSRFDEIVDEMVKTGVILKKEADTVVVKGVPVKGVSDIDDFRKLILIKDSVAEFIWHFLVGCVAITTAYNNMMNVVCQKTSIVDVPALPDTSSLVPTEIKAL